MGTTYNQTGTLIASTYKHPPIVLDEKVGCLTAGMSHSVNQQMAYVGQLLPVLKK